MLVVGRDEQAAETTRIIFQIYAFSGLRKSRDWYQSFLARPSLGIYFSGSANSHPRSKDALVSNNSVTIIFNGKPVSCRADTSVGVGLWENGVRHISHSHKYGKPRGLTCARGHCTSCLMRIDGEPNVRTCLTPVREGMVVDVQDAGAFYVPPAPE